ncbi:MAG: hypothetical protein U0892_03245 [Pirellulales bacterium]
MSQPHRAEKAVAVRNIIGNLLTSLDPQCRSMEYVLIAFEAMAPIADIRTAECEAAAQGLHRRDSATSARPLRRFRDESEARDEAA